MSNRYLATAAAIALLAGLGAASAQTEKQGAPSGSSAPGATQSAPGGSAGGKAGAQTQTQGQKSPGSAQTQGGSAGSKAGAQTQTQGSSPGSKAGAQTQTQGQKSPGSAQTRDKPDGAKSQAQDSDRSGPGQAGQAQKGMDRDSKTQDRAQDSDRSKDRDQARDRDSDRDRDSAAAGKGGTDVQISSEQRTEIRNVIVDRGSDLRRIDRTRINFTVNVGAVVPRTIELYPVPAYIVEVVPAYRGFRYIVVGTELLIIDPDTFAIVAVFPV